MEPQTPAYVITNSILPNGHGSLQAFYEAALPLIKRAGAEVLVSGRSGQNLAFFDGSWPDDAAVTIFKFPSMSSALAFLESDELVAAEKLRTAVVEPHFTFAVEGVPNGGPA